MAYHTLQSTVLAFFICNTAPSGYSWETAVTCPNSWQLKHLMTSIVSHAIALTHPTPTLPGFCTFAVAMAFGVTTSAALVPLSLLTASSFKSFRTSISRFPSLVLLFFLTFFFPLLFSSYLLFGFGLVLRNFSHLITCYVCRSYCRHD